MRYVTLADMIGARGVEIVTGLDERTVTAWMNQPPWSSEAVKEAREKAKADWCSEFEDNLTLDEIRLCADLLADAFRLPRRPEKDRSKYDYRSRIRHMGMSVEHYEWMLATQDGKCAICGGPPTLGRRLDIDHDHETGRIRGLLCHHCNTMLGQAHDSADVLQKAIRYLKRGVD
jgi:hypothetical protein